MNEEQYEKYKEELEGILQKTSCIVYNVKDDKYLRQLKPPQLEFDFSELSDQEQVQYVLAHSFCSDLLLIADWTDDYDEALKISGLYTLHTVLSTLLWNRVFDECKFFLVDENSIVDYDTLLTRKRDMDFIHALFEEFEI